MKQLDLLTSNEIGQVFAYPKEFLRLVHLGIHDLEPWYFIDGSSLRDLFSGLKKRYPKRKLVPFARRQDNDDIACWELDKSGVVYVIHDFASEGWEQKYQYNYFYDWLRKAIDDLIEFDA